MTGGARPISSGARRTVSHSSFGTMMDYVWQSLSLQPVYSNCLKILNVVATYQALSAALKITLGTISGTASPTSSVVLWDMGLY